MLPEELLDPVEPLPIEPPVVGEVVVPFLDFMLFEGTCDCCLFEWLIRLDDGGSVVLDEPVEPDDMDGDEPDMLPDDDWANAVPAINRAAAAVTINVRMRVPLGGCGRRAGASSQPSASGFVP